MCNDLETQSILDLFTHTEPISSLQSNVWAVNVKKN